MAIIVDINVAHKVFTTNDPDFAPVSRGLFNTGRGIRVGMVYGGKLKNEYKQSQKIWEFVLQLDRAGRAKVVADKDVDREEQRVTGMGICSSDDPHIIALARVSGVRLLCSHDTDLHSDFTNKSLIDKPRGRVYQNSSHTSLLRKYCTLP